MTRSGVALTRHCPTGDGRCCSNSSVGCPIDSWFWWWIAAMPPSTFLGVLANRRRAITCITRLRLDARLYAPAAPRYQGQIGRPRRKGARLPSLQGRVTDPKTPWRSVTVPHWYSAGPRTIQIATGTAVWYRVGLPVVPIRWVLIRDPQQQFRAQALLCTDLAVAPEQVVQWFVLRWQLETTWAEVRAHLGVESQRQWSDLAIARTTPCLLALFSLVTLLANDLHRRRKLQTPMLSLVQQAATNLLLQRARQRWQQ